MYVTNKVRVQGSTAASSKEETFRERMKIEKDKLCKFETFKKPLIFNYCFTLFVSACGVNCGNMLLLSVLMLD